MEPAASIIDRLGGNTVVAKAVCRLPHTVYRWKVSRERGGTGGRIPVDCRPQLLSLAKSQGIELSPLDLMSPTERGQAMGET